MIQNIKTEEGVKISSKVYIRQLWHLSKLVALIELTKKSISGDELVALEEYLDKGVRIFSHPRWIYVMIPMMLITTPIVQYEISKRRACISLYHYAGM